MQTKIYLYEKAYNKRVRGLQQTSQALTLVRLG